MKTLFAAIVLLSQSNPATLCHDQCQTSEAGIVLVQNFEGYSPVPYKDAAGLDTIGIGHLIRPGEDITIPLMPPDAHRLLKQDLRIAEKGVNRQVHVPLYQNQFDATVSWTFNLGEGALKTSTMLKRMNAERHEEVPKEMKRWVYAGGKKLRGLENRRAAEAELYALYP